MTGKTTEFPANGRTTKAWLSVPAAGSGPGVLVIQEWWGLVPHIQDVCDRLAAEGFTAMAPDLYHGEKTDSPDAAGKLMMALDIARAEKDLAAAVSHLKAQDATTGDRVGVVGFCMGGQLALYAASKNPDIGACADFYGIHPNVKPDFKSIRCPVLGIFAEKDAFVTPEASRKLQKDLEDAGVACEFTIFPGADHAFFNDTRKDVHHPQAAKQAWEKTLAFFRKHLT